MALLYLCVFISLRGIFLWPEGAFCTFLEERVAGSSLLCSNPSKLIKIYIMENCLDIGVANRVIIDRRKDQLFVWCNFVLVSDNFEISIPVLISR